MRAKHASSSYKCITTLIVTGTRHHYAAWVWSCTNFVHSAQYAPFIMQKDTLMGNSAQRKDTPPRALKRQVIMTWRLLQQILWF